MLPSSSDWAHRSKYMLIYSQWLLQASLIKGVKNSCHLKICPGRESETRFFNSEGILTVKQRWQASRENSFMCLDSTSVMSEAMRTNGLCFIPKTVLVLCLVPSTFHDLLRLHFKVFNPLMSNVFVFSGLTWRGFCRDLNAISRTFRDKSCGIKRAHFTVSESNRSIQTIHVFIPWYGGMSSEARRLCVAVTFSSRIRKLQCLSGFP